MYIHCDNCKASSHVSDAEEVYECPHCGTIDYLANLEQICPVEEGQRKTREDLIKYNKVLGLDSSEIAPNYSCDCGAKYVKDSFHSPWCSTQKGK